jgi:hypothetical protein
MVGKLSEEDRSYWKKLLEEVTLSDRLSGLHYFHGILLRWLRENEGELFQKIVKQVRWISKGYLFRPEVGEWIESRFGGDSSLKPALVADECCYYFKINPAMRPYLIRLAQRIKRRVAMRNRRRGKADFWLWS